MSKCSRERPLRLFAVLTRNRQSAVGLSGRTRSAQERPNRVFTIPPRQQLSSTRWLAIRTWRATHDLKSQVSFINKKRIRERRNSFRFRTREIREYKQRDKYIHRDMVQKQLRIEIKRNKHAYKKQKENLAPPRLRWYLHTQLLLRPNVTYLPCADGNGSIPRRVSTR